MRVIYPGTFDPPTKGHLNIIERAAKLFNHVEVAIGLDTEKETPIFSLEERLHFLHILAKPFPNVTVSAFQTLLVTYAKERNCSFIIRSLRTFSDFEHERTLAYANKKMSGIETLFLLPDEEFQSMSASLIRDIARRGGSLVPFIPEVIEPLVREKFLAMLQ